MWTTNAQELACFANSPYRDWILKPYNLSQALKRVCDQLKVQILFQGLDQYLDDEKIILNDFTSDRCYVRQVFLVGDDEPFCFARIVAPLSVFHHYEEAFTGLQGNLLGNTLLYSNPKTIRKAFEYSAIPRQHAYYQFLKPHLSTSRQQQLEQTLAARRSIFLMDAEHPLLVTELFLTGIPEYVGD